MFSLLCNALVSLLAGCLLGCVSVYVIAPRVINRIWPVPDFYDSLSHAQQEELLEILKKMNTVSRDADEEAIRKEIENWNTKYPESN